MQLHVLKVFVGDSGAGGNLLGVFLDGAAITNRQDVAADLGYSETVFVEDATSATVEIFTPAARLPFAGHPLVGTAWLLGHQGIPVDVLRPPAGEVPTWAADGLRWIRGRAEWSPPFELRQYDTPEQVDALSPPASGLLDAWTWVEESAGTIRSRVFAPDHGNAEDEATGSAAVALVTHLGRPIEIHQGTGSVLHARPGPAGTAEVGGRVELQEIRTY